ncbi:MAG: hypothetical protein IH948_01570 [Bacteroidetes bacterium]|nr:hypothetical protein [Bacteroidota bacterium]
MKYLIFLLGLGLIGLRIGGLPIGIPDMVLFVIISVIVSVKDLNSLTEIKWFGMSMKFKEELKELSEDTEALEDKAEKTDKKEYPLNGPSDSLREETKLFGDDEDSNFTGDMKFMPNMKDPKLSLMETVIKIEITLRNISDMSLEEENKLPISPRRIISELHKKELIDKDLFVSFEKFWKLRNKMVHGFEKNITDSHILSLVDSGLRILNILESIENNLHKDLKLFILD